MRSMVEGACGTAACTGAHAPSTTLLRSHSDAARRVVGATAAYGRYVPLPRFAGQDKETE
jgi:hypothetical protein